MTHIALNDITVPFVSYPTICQHVDSALYGVTFKSISYLSLIEAISQKYIFYIIYPYNFLIKNIYK